VARPVRDAQLAIGTLAATSPARIAATHLAGTIGDAVRDAGALGRAPGPGRAFAALAAAPVGSALLADAGRVALDLTLSTNAGLPGHAHPAATPAAVGPALGAGAGGDADDRAFEVLAFETKLAAAAFSATTVVPALLAFALRYANGAQPFRTARLAFGTIAARPAVAAVRTALLVVALWLTDGPALVVGVTLLAFRTGAAYPATLVIAAQLAETVGSAADAGPAQAGISFGAFPAVAATAVESALLVLTVGDTALVLRGSILNLANLGGIVLGGIRPGVHRGDIAVRRVYYNILAAFHTLAV